MQHKQNVGNMSTKCYLQQEGHRSIGELRSNSEGNLNDFHWFIGGSIVEVVAKRDMQHGGP
jgi:hypothetical protein